MRISSNGLAFIAREEGLVLHPYNDSQQHATIGVGHLLHLGPVTDADRRRYAHFSRADAIHLLDADVSKVEEAIKQHLHPGIYARLNQNEFDALCSLGFNIGTGGLASSTVLRDLNAGRARAAADAFLMWRKPPELLPRRKRERALFLKPVKVDPLAVLTSGEHAVVLSWRAHRTEAHREALVNARKRVWRAATHDPRGPAHGWAQLHRRQRYDLLKSELHR